MLIGIDGNEANLPIRVGVGQYAYHILSHLHRLKSNNDYYIYLKSAPLPDMPQENKHWHYRIFGPGKLWTRLALPWHLYTDGLALNLFYSPSHYSPSFCPFPTIPTIHDLGYLDTPDQFTTKDFHQLKNWTLQSLKKAAKIAAVSEFSKSEIHRIYGISQDKIFVAANGVTPPDNSMLKNKTSVLKKFKITSPYFLYLGTLKPSKNIPFLIKAFSNYLKSKPSVTTLVIAGKKGWLYEEIFKVVQKEGITASVIFTDYISESEKWSLYSGAVSTVLPSLCEGFGIPAIESQIVGTPVILSEIAAFKEVAPDSAIFINPYDSKTLISALKQVTDPKTRQKIAKVGIINARRYSWEASAKSVLEAFDTL